MSGALVNLVRTALTADLLIPLEGHFGNRGVGVGAVVDRLDHELHPTGPYRSNINFLTVHPVIEVQIAGGAVRELGRYGRQPIVLGPDCRALEIAGLNQDAMQIDLAIE